MARRRRPWSAIAIFTTVVQSLFTTVSYIYLIILRLQLARMLWSQSYFFILAILSKIVNADIIQQLTNRKNDGLFKTPSFSVTGRGAIPPSLSTLRIREFDHECFRFTFEGCFAAALTFTPWGAWKERLIPVLLLNIESVSRKSTRAANAKSGRRMHRES